VHKRRPACVCNASVHVVPSLRSSRRSSSRSSGPRRRRRLGARARCVHRSVDLPARADCVAAVRGGRPGARGCRACRIAPKFEPYAHKGWLEEHHNCFAGATGVIPVNRASRDSLERAPCSSGFVAPESAVRLAAADGAAITIAADGAGSLKGTYS
jgi:hypothetical protein